MADHPIDYQGPSTDQSASAYDLAYVGVKLLGLYWLADGLMMAIYSAMEMSSSPPNRGGINWVRVWQMGGPGMEYLGLAFISLFFTRLVVDKAMGERNGRSALSVRGRGLQAVSFSVVGVMMVAYNVPTLVQYALGYYYKASMGWDRQSWMPEVASSGVRVGIGVYLFMRSKVLAGVWERANRRR